MQSQQTTTDRRRTTWSRIKDQRVGSRIVILRILGYYDILIPQSLNIPIPTILISSSLVDVLPALVYSKLSSIDCFNQRERFADI